MHLYILTYICMLSNNNFQLFGSSVQVVAWLSSLLSITWGFSRLLLLPLHCPSLAPLSIMKFSFQISLLVLFAVCFALVFFFFCSPAFALRFVTSSAKINRLEFGFALIFFIFLCVSQALQISYIIQTKSRRPPTSHSRFQSPASTAAPH